MLSAPAPALSSIKSDIDDTNLLNLTINMKVRGMILPKTQKVSGRNGDILSICKTLELTTVGDENIRKRHYLLWNIGEHH